MEPYFISTAAKTSLEVLKTVLDAPLSLFYSNEHYNEDIHFCTNHALRLAVKHKKVDIARELIKRGANVNYNDYITSDDEYEKEEKDEKEEQDLKEIMEMMIQVGVEEKQLGALLHGALERRKYNLVLYLIGHGALNYVFIILFLFFSFLSFLPSIFCCCNNTMIVTSGSTKYHCSNIATR